MASTQLKISAPLPSPIPTATGSRSAANNILSEYLENSLQIPDLTLPEPHFPASTRHPIPAEFDLRSLTSREGDSVDPLLRSAREFGAFRISFHGISGQELRSLVTETERVFGVQSESDGEFRRNFGGRDGYREEIACLRYGKERTEWTGEYIGAERYRSFREKMENVARKLIAVAEQLSQIFSENAGKQYGKRIQRGDSVLSIYRYKQDNIIEQNPLLPNERTNKSCDHTISLHLPTQQCEFRFQSGQGPLSFSAGPDTIVVTLGKQIEEWSLGEFKCVYGEVICDTDLSMELKCSSFDLNHSTTYKRVSIADQILIALIIAFLYYIFTFICS